MNTKALRPFRLALAQMLVTGGARDENVARAVARIGEAAAAGAEVVVLPECLDLGWTHPSSRTEAEPIPGGGPYEALVAAARTHGVYVCGGLTERYEPPGGGGGGGACGTRVYNAAVLIDPAGALLLHHRKINELDIGHDVYDPGDRMRVARTPFGTVGVMICADAFAEGQVISRTLGYMGADVILSPSAWAVESVSDYSEVEPYGRIWRDNYAPVARDFSVWIAGVSNVGAISGGAWSGWSCIGASLVFGPNGEEVLQGPYGLDADTIISLTVTPVPRPARGHEWSTFGRSRTGLPEG
jgi:predicted amidohydrolase